MYKPNYQYTNKIVKNLTLIAEARTIILNVPLVPKWKISLRREALLKSAHSSTAIEGNPLSYEEVSALAEGREVMVSRKDKQEVLNYLEALERIPEFAKKYPFQNNDLLDIHKIVTKDTLENPKDEGSFRNRQVVVANKATGEIIFKPPPTKQVPRLVNEFFLWYNSKNANEIDSVIKAGLVHYEIVRIHPFIDGNGRTARILATLTLYMRGFDTKRYFALDDYYDHDRRSYYEVLSRVDTNTINLTEWLEYFTEGVVISSKAVKDKVIGISKDIKFLKERGQIALTKRQMNIVEHVMNIGHITSGELSIELGISRQAALKEMKKLVDLKVVKLVGKGKGAHYVLI